MNLIAESEIEISMTWKRCSRNLFDKACDLESFTNALKWCGMRSSVLRTIKHDEFNVFAEWLYNNLDKINKGSINFLNCKIPGVSKTPKSFISKVCHIINPRKYPIIYDSHINNWFKSIGTTYEEEVHEDIMTMSMWARSEEDIWYHDCRVWAGIN